LFSQTLHSLLRIIYSLLYHSFAWTYDLVAGIVSFGQWTAWVQQVIPYIQGRNVLELGFGPGHLQAELRQRGFQVFGLDESPQMIRQASRKLIKNNEPLNLTRGVMQNIPFRSVFDTIVATFPSEYIFNPDTIKEISRALIPGGKVVILLGVSPWNFILRSKLLKGREINEQLNQRLNQICQKYEEEGMQTEIIKIPYKSVSLITLRGEKAK
jgi:ubiquinone/menaquinone biosynthesis C-methylase UbiE